MCCSSVRRTRRRIQENTGLLTSVLRNVMEQIILSAVMQHVKDNQGIRPNKHRFVKDRS